MVIATGGFEHNAELKRAFLRGPCTHTVAVETNTGDGLKMAMRVGAMLGNMREAWWMPMIELPTDIVPTGPAAAHLRAHAAGSRSWSTGGASASPTRRPTTTRSAPPSTSRTRPWACTATCRAGWCSTRPGSTSTASPAASGGTEKARTDWITAGDTPAELAEKLGIPADALEETIERFNANARDLHDPDFKRGWSAQDQWWGDPTLRDGTARASLGPVETAPYYAIQVFSGALGTKGGPPTDTHARVLDVDGDVIPGLYAAGNAMASPLGMTYGGAGGTLGPAMVFGYLAGRDIAQRGADRRRPSALAAAHGGA